MLTFFLPSLFGPESSELGCQSRKQSWPSSFVHDDFTKSISFHFHGYEIMQHLNYNSISAKSCLLISFYIADNGSSDLWYTAPHHVLRGTRSGRKSSYDYQVCVISRGLALGRIHSSKWLRRKEEIFKGLIVKAFLSLQRIIR